MKPGSPHATLLSLVDEIADDKRVARALGICSAYVAQWRPRPRTLPDGREIIEDGLEPSAGFMAVALAALRGRRY